jgi:hypothetical protein
VFVSCVIKKTVKEKYKLKAELVANSAKLRWFTGELWIVAMRWHS